MCSSFLMSWIFGAHNSNCIIISGSCVTLVQKPEQLLQINGTQCHLTFSQAPFLSLSLSLSLCLPLSLSLCAVWNLTTHQNGTCPEAIWAGRNSKKLVKGRRKKEMSFVKHLFSLHSLVLWHIAGLELVTEFLTLKVSVACVTWSGRCSSRVVIATLVTLWTPRS